MYGPQVLENYDIVVSIEQQAINRQLAALAQQGVIPNRFRVRQDTDDQGNYSYVVYAQSGDLPKDGSGALTSSFIDAAITPQIQIIDSGTMVNLVIAFGEGVASFIKGGRTFTHDTNGWSYTLAVNLNLLELQQTDIAAGKAVPDLVRHQLTQFTGAMFDIRHLFLDFNSSDLTHFDPTGTAAATADGAGAVQDLTLFMQFFLVQIKTAPNGFILGYVPVATAQTTLPPNLTVPYSLLPVGTSYLLMKNPNPDRSTLNFAIVTRGGHQQITGSPSPVDFNLQSAVDPSTAGGIQAMHETIGDLTNFNLPVVQNGSDVQNDQYDATIAYAHGCLVDQLILQPMFTQIRNVHDQVKDYVDTNGPGADYAGALTMSGPGQWNFHIQNSDVDNDLYKNSFSVVRQETGTAVALVFIGTISATKEKSRNMLFCTARASSTVTQPWTCTVNLAVGGNNALVVSSGTEIPPLQGPDNWHNDCSSAASVLGDVLDGITSLGGLISGGATHVLSGASVGGMGNFDSAFRNLPSAIGSLILLPTGQALAPVNVGCDGAGNIWMGANLN